MNKNNIHLTQAMYTKLMKLDETLIGTAEYMGIAFFWNYEYRHAMRGASRERMVDIHNKLLAAGLTLDGNSPEHDAIINRTYVFNYSVKRSKNGKSLKCRYATRDEANAHAKRINGVIVGFDHDGYECWNF